MAVDTAADGRHANGSARSLRELAEVPELVVAAVPLERVTAIATEAAAIGAKALLVVSSEPDEPAAARELGEELLETVRTQGLRLIGPRSLGVLNTDPAVRLDATFAAPPPVPGRLAICSPSSAIGVGLLGHAAARRLGISSFVGLGDRLDVSTNDLLELWEEDERTAAVMLYLDTFGNPERFARVARRVSRRKPILAVKGRRAAEAARRDAQSHTAAALRGDAVVDAMFKQAGMLRFHSGDALFSAASFFESQPLPLGRRVGIVSNSAGVATLAADACATHQLQPAFPNGVIMLGQRAKAAELAAALRTLLRDPSVDAATVHYIDILGGDPQAVLVEVSRVAAAQHKPVVASILRKDGSPPSSGPDLVPNFRFPETCASVLSRGAERREWLSRPLGQGPDYDDIDIAAANDVVASYLPADGRQDGQEQEQEQAWLTVPETENLLGSHGIPVVPSIGATSVEEAVAVGATIGGPLALRADFPPPAHTGDVAAVLLGLEGPSAIEAGWRELEHRVELGPTRLGRSASAASHGSWRRCARRSNDRSRPWAGNGRRPGRAPGRTRIECGVRRPAHHRCRGGRADRGIRGGRQATRRLPGLCEARPQALAI